VRDWSSDVCSSDLRHQAQRPVLDREPATQTLVLAGLDLAPVLIPRLTTAYHELYPSVDFRILGGGSRQALEGLANGQVELAFLNRLPTPEEKKAIRSVLDSVWTYPIALGGIAVLSSSQGGRDSVRIDELRSWIKGDAKGGSWKPSRFYAPDPNLGLWTSLTSQLDLPDTLEKDVVWMADEGAVARAVGADPTSLGFAGTLSLGADLERSGARIVPINGGGTGGAAFPVARQIAAGEYPLYHYLYLCCRPDPGAAASAFITFMYNGRGQRLVEREGFLPARQIARVVQLVQKPIG
jgi:ABC-type phosphate transport system substrate-binding protein